MAPILKFIHLGKQPSPKNSPKSQESNKIIVSLGRISKWEKVNYDI